MMEKVTAMDEQGQLEVSWVTQEFVHDHFGSLPPYFSKMLGWIIPQDENDRALGRYRIIPQRPGDRTNASTGTPVA